MDKYDLILNYAKENYKKMFREPDGILHHKFIVPGATYSNSLWDWDSWLTNIALRSFTEEDISEYEKGCIINFIEHIDEDGKIPIFITPTMEWYNFDGSFPSNIHKPCLAQHAEFIVKTNNNDVEWLRPYFDKILKFIDYYYNNQRHACGLYYWLNDCAIGVDNDPSTYYRPEKSSASIYLNCLMYKELIAVCYLGNLLNTNVDFYKNEAENLLKTVRDLCYDEKDGMYYSADLNLLPVNPDSKLHSGAPRHWDSLIQRIGCWSGFMAMWAGIATPEQAKRMVTENLLDEKSFWAPYGVRTLSKYEKMYRIVKSGNPSCWLGPIWGISNYMVFEGLLNYGFINEAKELAEKSLKLFGQDVEKTGVFHEYYDPESGEPINNPGFQNWNLFVIKMGKWLKENQ
jgi:putative isomerase